MKSFIKLTDVSFSYRIDGLETLVAVNKVSMEIKKGAHVAVLGRNGSGKSTLARLISGLESPDSGEVVVDGTVLDSEESVWEVRRKCGTVFQNPDNQIIGTTVEEDVAFGPENIGMPREKMIVEIDKALEAVGLGDRKKTAPHLLSGGQKQKLAIAGILAMNPQCFILDEATSMLDPPSRKDFMDLVSTLVKERNLTVVNITHNMEEAVLADYVYVMSDGEIVMEGHPEKVFEEHDLIKNEGLDVPVHMEIARVISELAGIPLRRGEFFTPEGAKNEILRICSAASGKKINGILEKLPDSGELDAQDILKVENLSYTYSKETVFAKEALSDVSFSIKRGELFGVAGQTGSGKSTLIQHFNGLIRPQSGHVRVMEYDTSKKESIREIRKKAGLLFQYPEHQLFEETVYKDIAFGPKCLKMNEEEIEKSVYGAIKIAGLEESILSKSPFELSGGQKRRVAIAGIIAMNPEILILDEPAAGLDPEGREEILSFVKNLCDSGTTVVLVSHNMDDIARLADRILVLKNGENVSCSTPGNLFSSNEKIIELGLSLPLTTVFMETVKKDIPGLDTKVFTPIDCARAILEGYKVREAL